jgi:hypothetical protein
MTLKYPRDMIVTDQTDYIKFDFWTYKPPLKRGGSGLSGYNQTNSTGGNDIDGNFGSGPLDSINIYMPQDVSTSYATSWGGKELSNFGAGALSGYANITNGNLGGLADNAAQGVQGLVRLPTALGGELARMGLQTMQTNLTLNDILSTTQGVILNPNVELFFGGPQIRNIGFAFKMFGRNKEEAVDMINICNIFKKQSLASFGGSPTLDEGVAGFINDVGNFAQGTQNSALDIQGNASTPASAAATDYQAGYLTVPNLCRMQLMKGGAKHPYLSQYKALAITNVDINYTPDGSYSTLIDGIPSAVELRVSFVETKIVYRNDLNKSGWTY